MLLSVRSQCGGFVGNGERRRRRMSPRSETLLKERLMVLDRQCGGFTEGGRADMYGAEIIRVGQWQDVRDLGGKTLVEKNMLKRRGERIPPCSTPLLMETTKWREEEGSPTMHLWPSSILATIFTDAMERPARARERRRSS
jgi:hypothetical protein